MAGGQGRQGPVPRLAPARSRRARRVRAGSRDRNDARRAEGQGARDPGALFHQSHLGAPAHGRRRGGFARPGRQRRACRQEPLRRDARVLRGRRAGVFGGRVGRYAARPARVQGQAPRRVSPSPRSRRWAHASPRPRPGGRLLGRRLRLHRHQGPAGHHRRPGRLREPAGDVGAPLYRRSAAARAADRRHRPLRGGARPPRHRRRDEARPCHPRSRSAERRRHRLDRRNDRRRRDARGHEYPALPAPDHRRGPVAKRQSRDGLAMERVRAEEGTRAEGASRGRRARSRGSTSSVRATASSTCPRISPKSAVSSKESAPKSTWSFRSAAMSKRFRGSPTPKSMSASIANIGRLLCEALGAAVSAGADRPAQHDEIPSQPRRAARPRSRALHRPREAHDDQADLGSLALGDPGLLRHRDLRHRRQRDLRARRPAFPRGGDGSALPVRGRRAVPAKRRTTTPSAGRCARRRRW